MQRWQSAEELLASDLDEPDGRPVELQAMVGEAQGRCDCDACAARRLEMVAAWDGTREDDPTG